MGLDILVVLDTSNSMRAEDVRPSRLERSKLGIRDLVRRLNGDRIGLIPFAGDSYLYCPLTADYGAFMMMLDDIYPGIIPRGGTAIEQALRRAMNAFDDQVLADRVIILITDGEDHEGNPLNLMEEMQRRGIKLFAVGIGTPDGDLIPMIDEQGRTQMLRDRQGNVVVTRLQEDLLERLATRTGGMYVRATPTDFGLDQIVDLGIAPLQRTELDTELLLTYRDRYAWFLGLAFLLLAVEAALRDGRAPRREVTA
jgi:Ca-activated chloride channel family protein